MSKPIEVTDNTFEEEVLNSDKLVIVDFWAAWCGPCKMIAPVLDEIAAEYADRVKVAKVDVDANNATAARYSVMSIPSLLFFRNGEVVDQAVGTATKAQVAARLEGALA